MTPLRPWIRIAPIVCACTIAACAPSRPTSAPPPRLPIPAEAARPCVLAALPRSPTAADLETAYVRRGLALVECDAARRSALDVLHAERAMIDRWLAGRPAP